MQGEFFYWGPLLYKNKVSQKLIDGLLTRGNDSNIDFRSHLAGILKKESKYNMDDKQFFVNEIGPIMADYAHIYEKYYGENLQHKVFQLEDLWINYMYPGDYNPLHVHTEDISFIIYLQIPQELIDEHNEWKEVSSKAAGPGTVQFLYGQPSDQFINSRFFLPEVGDIYIFPAQLYHTVAPFKSGGVRISVAGNYNVIDKPI